MAGSVTRDQTVETEAYEMGAEIQITAPSTRAMLRDRLPQPLLKLVRRAKHFGLRHQCPVCGSHLRHFVPFNGLEGTMCPVCASMHRHRLAWLVLRDQGALFDGLPKRLLHVAPEPTTETMLRELPGVDYRSCDLEPGKAMDVADLTALTYQDGQFDFIYCSHVLEHVDDDRKAMRELRRVLSPSGFGLLMVPIFRADTIEDPSITDPEERVRLFGQEDHVRAYGEDFVDRLAAAGFTVTSISSDEIVPPAEHRKMGLFPGERAFVVT